MPQALIGRGNNHFQDIIINDEILFDNFELKENDQGTMTPVDNTFDINNNGTNLFSLDQSGNLVITGSLTANGLITDCVQDADGTTKVCVADVTDVITFQTNSLERGRFKTAGDFNLITGNAYQINDVDVLTNNTLGSGVNNSSITTNNADLVNVGDITIGDTINDPFIEFDDTSAFKWYMEADVGAPNSFRIGRRGFGTPDFVTINSTKTAVGGALLPTAVGQDFSLNSKNVGFGEFAGALQFLVTSGEAMRISSTGFLGIGTDNPKSNLHINTSSATSGLNVTATLDSGAIITTDEAGKCRLYFENIANTTGERVFYITNDSTGLEFSSLSNDATSFVKQDIFLLKSNGNSAFDTDTLFIDAVNDRVGINNSSPTELIDVTMGDLDIINFKSSTMGDRVQIRIGNGDTDLNIGIAGTNNDFLSGSLEGDACIRAFNSTKKLHLSASLLPVITITSGDDVGIRTTTPTHELEIRNTTQPQMLIGTTANGGGEIFFGNGNHGVGRATGLTNFTDGNDVVLHTIGVAGGSGLKTAGGFMRLSQDGAIGLNKIPATNREIDVLMTNLSIIDFKSGTSSDRVHINIGNGDTSMALAISGATNDFFTGSADGDACIQVSANDLILGTAASGGNIRTFRDNVEHQRMTTDGQTLFYQDTSTATTPVIFLGRNKSYVSGDVIMSFQSSRTSIAGSGTGQGGIRMSAVNGTPEFFNGSDINIKKDIEDYEDGYDIVKEVRTAKFKFKEDNSEGIGFIAQEIQAKLPNHVHKHKKMKTKIIKKVISKEDEELVEEDQEVETDEVDYEYLTIGSSFQPIVLWSALREAINKIETLEAKVLALENP